MVRLLDTFEDNEYVHLVMELASGGCVLERVMEEVRGGGGWGGWGAGCWEGGVGRGALCLGARDGGLGLLPWCKGGLRLKPGWRWQRKACA
jgi:hypothetical protein